LACPNPVDQCRYFIDQKSFVGQKGLAHNGEPSPCPSLAQGHPMGGRLPAKLTYRRMDPVTNLSFFRGYVLRIDGKDKLFSQCCGD
jgi:hypothetical protein